MSCKLRPHHGMCMTFFQGKGYSSEFTAHMGKVIDEMKENPMVCLLPETDVVCQKCPNNLDGLCNTAEKVARYDEQVLSLCSLTAGQTLLFADFQKKVFDNILSCGKRETVCGDCQWTDLCHFEK